MATVEAPSRPGHRLRAGWSGAGGAACNVDLVHCNRSDGPAVGRHRFHCRLADSGRAWLCMDPPSPVDVVLPPVVLPVILFGGLRAGATLLGWAP